MHAANYPAFEIAKLTRESAHYLSIERSDGAVFRGKTQGDGAWVVWPEGLSSRFAGRTFGSVCKTLAAVREWVL